MSRKIVEKYRLSEKDREDIGLRFHQVIKDHSFDTIQQFADEYEISRSTIQHWLAEGKINIQFMRVFCEKFNIDLRWLLFGPPYPKHQKPRP